MKRVLLFLLLSLLTKGASTMATELKPTHEVRTYMSFTWPVDPVKIITLPDMDLSYALASTLVEWGPSKQPAAGLASEWKITDEKTYQFTLREGLKWSDGKPVTSEQVKESFERGMRAHPDDLRSLINLVDSISCPNETTIDFKLKSAAKTSNLLGKLTEPNYGVLKVTAGGALDLSITTGAFYIAEGTKSDLVLRANPSFVHGSAPLASQILIRRMPQGANPQEILLTDSWPNLIQTPSLLPASITSRYQNSNFELWNRPTDRVFIFQLSPRHFSKEGQGLFRYINSRINRETLVTNLEGYSLTKQMVPVGYKLFDQHFDDSSLKNAERPETFRSRPLEVLYSPERVNPILLKNIESELTRIFGHKPHFSSISMSEQITRYKKADYDFYVGTVGVADPDPEGLMSFYLENDLRFIPEINQNFIHRLDEARRSSASERLLLMRSILTDATLNGHIIPVFHLSTMGIARDGILLTQIPSTDESVTLSKIRFKEKLP